MGLAHSVFLTEYPQMFPSQRTVFTVNASQVYNFLQESLLHPYRYIFYDVRSRLDFMTLSLQYAEWGWEGNAATIQGTDTEMRKRNSGFYKSLREEVENRTIVVFGDERHKSEMITFFEHLHKAGGKPRLCCVLKESFKIFIEKRYSPLLSTSQMQINGPIEILPPRNLKGFSGAAICVSGTDLLSDQEAMIAHFRINHVVNVSSTSVQLSQKIPTTTYSSRLGTPDLVQVAKAIQSLVKQRKRIMVVDDFHGREYAAASCVSYLVTEGVSIDNAIQYVKEKKPSADMNHLMAVHSLIRSITLSKTGVCKGLYKRPLPAVSIPTRFLDEGDEEKHLLIEIIERPQGDNVIKKTSIKKAQTPALPAQIIEDTITVDSHSRSKHLANRFLLKRSSSPSNKKLLSSLSGEFSASDRSYEEPIEKVPKSPKPFFEENIKPIEPLGKRLPEIELKKSFVRDVNGKTATEGIKGKKFDAADKQTRSNDTNAAAPPLRSPLKERVSVASKEVVVTVSPQNNYPDSDQATTLTLQQQDRFYNYSGTSEDVGIPLGSGDEDEGAIYYYEDGASSADALAVGQATFEEIVADFMKDEETATENR